MKYTEKGTYLTMEDLPRIKKLYNKAVKDGDHSFIYERQILMTSYAKYVIEHMESKYKKS